MLAAKWLMKPKATNHPHLAFAAFGHAPSNEMMYDVKLPAVMAG